MQLNSKKESRKDKIARALKNNLKKRKIFQKTTGKKNRIIKQ